jgi:hypothetical protein
MRAPFARSGRTLSPTRSNTPTAAAPWCWGRRSSGNAAILSVTDKGAGMSEEDVRLALEPFAQGGNARGVKGTGLGLAVVKRFAELHGGQIDIRSTLGKGTRVSVTLPRAHDADIDLWMMPRNKRACQPLDVFVFRQACPQQQEQAAKGCTPIANRKMDVAGTARRPDIGCAG